MLITKQQIFPVCKRRFGVRGRKPLFPGA